jgi:hypothetical protein
MLRDPRRPKLVGGNIGIWRSDYERVNGYDENFRGWGCEDDDLRLRLRAAGIRVASIAWWTNIYHLWHPKTLSAPPTWRQGANVEYLQRPIRLTRCLAGLTRRRLQDLNIHVVGRQPPSAFAEEALPLWCRVGLSAEKKNAVHLRAENGPGAEVELALAPTCGKFSSAADCRVLLVPRGAVASRELIRGADLIFADCAIPGAEGRTFSLAAFDGIMQRQLGAMRSAATRTSAVAAAA